MASFGDGGVMNWLAYVLSLLFTGLCAVALSQPNGIEGAHIFLGAIGAVNIFALGSFFGDKS